MRYGDWEGPSSLIDGRMSFFHVLNMLKEIKSVYPAVIFILEEITIFKIGLKLKIIWIAG